MCFFNRREKKMMKFLKSSNGRRYMLANVIVAREQHLNLPDNQVFLQELEQLNQELRRRFMLGQANKEIKDLVKELRPDKNYTRQYELLEFLSFDKDM